MFEHGVVGEGFVGGVFGIRTRFRQWILSKMICRMVAKV